MLAPRWSCAVLPRLPNPRRIRSTLFKYPSSRSLSSAPPLGVANPDSYFESRERAIAHCTREGYDPHSLVEVGINWSHQDQFSHVNNVHTFTFFESSRILVIRALAREMDDEDAERAMMTGSGGVGVILGTVTAKYYKPVVFPDQLLVAHRVRSIGKDRFALDSLCYSFAQGCAVTGGSCELVTYDYTALRKIDIPSDMRAALERRMDLKTMCES